MKTKITLPILLIFLLLNCKENKLESIVVSDFQSSGCKDFTKSSANSTGDFVETVRISSYGTSNMKFEHINSTFNCSPSELKIEVEVKGDTIIINEIEINPKGNCFCQYDLECNLNGVELKTYWLKLYSLDVLRSVIEINNFEQNEFEITLYPRK